MGRGKGRVKGIDVTKHFFQTSDPSSRILVQVTPSHSFYVKEEDLSPTQGSEAAFALKRDGRAEGAMKLCQNWKQGVCHSYTACNNAHVMASFSGPPAQPHITGGASNVSATAGVLMQRTREDGNYSGSQHHSNNNNHHHNHNHNNNNNNHNHNNNTNTSNVIQSGTVSVESSRMLENKGSSMGTHSTFIPAPRSQQVNRQASLGGSSGTVNSLGASTAWGRNGAASTSQHGNYYHHHQPHPHNQQQQQLLQYQRHHHHHNHNQNQKKHSTPRSKSWVTAQKASDDIIWAFSNDAVGEMLMGAATPRQLGANERAIIETPQISVNSNSRASNTGDGSHFAQSDNNDAVFCSDVWLAPSLGKSPVSAAIWGDVNAGVWDLPSSGAATTHLPTVGTSKTEKEEVSIFATHETVLNGPLTSHGELWGTFSHKSGESTVGDCVVAGAPSSCEALKNQLLRELVGAGVETSDSFVLGTQLNGGANNNNNNNNGNGVETVPFAFSVGRNLPGRLGVLGASDTTGSEVYEGKKATCGVMSTQTKSTDTIQHLMSLLTTE